MAGLNLENFKNLPLTLKNMALVAFGTQKYGFGTPMTHTFPKWPFPADFKNAQYPPPLPRGTILLRKGQKRLEKIHLVSE